MPKAFHKMYMIQKNNIQGLEHFFFQTTFIPAVFHQIPHAALKSAGRLLIQMKHTALCSGTDSFSFHMSYAATKSWIKASYRSS